MTKQFTGKIEPDIRDSVPDWAPYLAPRQLLGYPTWVRARSVSQPAKRDSVVVRWSVSGFWILLWMCVYYMQNIV